MTIDTHTLKTQIESAFTECHALTPQNVSSDLQHTILQTLNLLDQGKLRIAEKTDGTWHVHEWLKKAVLLSFRIQENQSINGEFTQYYDKIPLKYNAYSAQQFATEQVRIVPPAVIRHGAFIGPNTVIMPSYVNIGAYVAAGSMIDTWATVGSCVQVGQNVHISGGVGLGGVLEPLQAHPTIIEDNCFIGARSEIVEGVIVGEGAVISMGVYIGQSTPIYNRQTQTITYGKIPPGSVVVPGNLPAKDGSHSLYCAVIVKQVDAKTRSKIGINALLRELNIE